MLNEENLNALKIAIEKEIKLGKKQVGWKLGFGSQAGLKALGIKSLYDLQEVTYLGFTKVF